jgi:hypothetical protein
LDLIAETVATVDATVDEDVADCGRRTQGGAPSRRARDKRLRDSSKGRRTDLDGGHREHGAMAAASARERSAADALVSEGRTLMLKVRTATVNGTLDRDHAIAERWIRHPFRRAA